MIGELEKARVKGLSFSEIQGDIFRLIRSFASKNCEKFSILKEFGFEVEDVISLSYVGLCKRKDDGLSYLERYFIEASNLNVESNEKGNKYFICVLRKAVYNVVLMMCRDINNSRVEGFVPYEEVEEYIPSRELNDSSRLEYEDLLREIPLLSFDKYEIRIGGNVAPLNSRTLLNALVGGLCRRDLLELIFNKETGKNITPAVYNLIRYKVVNVAKEVLKNYKKDRKL